MSSFLLVLSSRIYKEASRNSDPYDLRILDATSADEISFLIIIKIKTIVWIRSEKLHFRRTKISWPSRFYPTEPSR